MSGRRPKFVSPEIEAKKAFLPSRQKIDQVKRWQAKITNIPKEDCPYLPAPDAPGGDNWNAANNTNNNTPDQQPVDADASSSGQKQFEWKKVAKFDTAITLEMLTELAKGQDDADEEEDELRFGALKRAITRFDERPGMCFTRDILCSILSVAAHCQEILLPPPQQKNEPEEDDDDDDDGGENETNKNKRKNQQQQQPLLPVNTMMQGASYVRMTKLQCYCVMACSFLGIFPRVNHDCTDATRTLPSINLSGMYEIVSLRSVGPIVNVEKLLMFFEYFYVMAKRSREGDPRLTSDKWAVIFVRGVTPKDIPVFDDESFNFPMHDLQVMDLRKSIDDQRSTLRVDFANAIVGGASLSFGCVQEEIMFAECPEMNVARWMNPELLENEALLILRAERFASHSGYAHSLMYQGPHSDGDADILSSAVFAVDAIDFRYGVAATQFRKDAIMRDFKKLLAALDACNVARRVFDVAVPSTITTGNWGCGVFGGNAHLKALIQWLAFSVYGYNTIYCPFDNAGLQQQLKDVSICVNARTEKLTCAQVGKFLMKVGDMVTRGGPNVLEIFARAFQLPLEMAGESLHAPPQRIKSPVRRKGG